MNEALKQLLIEQAPTIIGFTKDLFAKHNPGVPEPTSEEVIAAYEAGYLSSIAKDEAIKHRDG